MEISCNDLLEKYVQAVKLMNVNMGREPMS